MKITETAVAAIAVLSYVAACGCSGAARASAAPAGGAPGSGDGDAGGPDAATGSVVDSGGSDAAEGGQIFGNPPPLMLTPPTRRRIVAGGGYDLEYVTCATSVRGPVVCWGTDQQMAVTHDALSGPLFNLTLGSAGIAEPLCGVTASGSLACATWTGISTLESQWLSDCARTKTGIADILFDRRNNLDLALVDRSGRALLVNASDCSSSLPPIAGTSLHHFSVVNGHACGIDPGGAAVCWIQGITDDAGVAIVEPTVADAYFDIVESDIEACAITATGKVRCWDYMGADTSGRDFPRALSKLASGAVELATDGLGHNVCALMVDGSVQCSADFTIGSTSQPLSNDRFVEIAVGTGHVCGIHPDGTVACAPFGCQGCSANIQPPLGFVAIAAQ